MLPLLLSNYLIKKNNIALYVALFLMLPTPYPLFKNQLDSNFTLNLLYHGWKISAVIFYYSYLLKKVIIKKSKIYSLLKKSIYFFILIWLISSIIFAIYYKNLTKSFKYLNICVAENWFNRGEELHIKGKIKEAFFCYLKALEYYPLSRLHRNLGAIYANQKDYKKALYHFEEYIRLKPHAEDANQIMNYCNYFRKILQSLEE
jgi:tetratricopeptide (TPR) repeat protein